MSDKVVFKTFLPESVDVHETERKSVFTISSGNIDRDNDVVNPDGWDFSTYRLNPCVLWAHDAKQPPIAKSLREWVVDGRVRSVAEWPEKGIHDFADKIFSLVQGGFIRGTSVGFRPIAAEPRIKGGFHYQKQELMEWSILPIPSNRDALREAKAAKLDIVPAFEWCEQVLSGDWDAKLWVSRDLVEKAVLSVRPEMVGYTAKKFNDGTHSRAAGKFSGLTHDDRALLQSAADGAGAFPNHKRHPLDVASERDAMTRAHSLIAGDGKRTRPLTNDERALLGHMAARAPKKETEVQIILTPEQITKYIRQEGGKYTVHSESGKPLGTYSSAKKARKRLAQIEYFKHRDEHKGLSADEVEKRILGLYGASSQPAIAHARDQHANAQATGKKARRKKEAEDYLATDPVISVELLKEACPACYEAVTKSGLTEVKVKELSQAALDGLCSKFGEAGGFRSRCMESGLSKDFDSVGAFCNWLKIQCHGSASAGDEKGAVVVTIKVPGDVAHVADTSAAVFGGEDEPRPDSETATIADDGDDDDRTSEDTSILELAKKLFAEFEEKGKNPFSPKKDDSKAKPDAGGDGKLEPPKPPADDASPEDHARHAQDAANYAQAAAAKAKAKQGQGSADTRGQAGGDQQVPPNAAPPGQGGAANPGKLQADLKNIEQQITSIQPGDPATVATQLKTILEAFAAVVMADLTGVQANAPGPGGTPTPPGQASNAPGQMPQTQRGAVADVLKQAAETLGLDVDEMIDIIDKSEDDEFQEFARKEFGVDASQLRATIIKSADAAFDEKMRRASGKLPD